MNRVLVAAALVLAAALPACAGSGNGTLYRATSLGGDPPSYRLEVSSTTGVTVGDHLMASTPSGGTGVWEVTAKTATTLDVEDSLTEQHGAAFGAPTAGGAQGRFSYSTPTAEGLTLIPDGGLYWAAAQRRNTYLAATTLSVPAHAFVGADHTGAASVGSAQATLQLVPGTHVQVYSAELDAFVALAPADGRFLRRTGGAWTASTIGAGDLPTHTHGAADLTSLPSHQHAAGDVTSGQLAVARGGTGAATAAEGAVFAGPGSGGAGAPSFRALVAGDLPSHTHAAASDLTGQVPVANGGTGAATAAANVFFAGPTSGGAAAPSFRAVVAGDLPAGLATLGAITTATHGHIFVSTAQGTIVNLAPGADDEVLTRDSTAALGVKWAAASGGGTLAETLALGNTTGGTSIVVSSGDRLAVGGSSTSELAIGKAGTRALELTAGDGSAPADAALAPKAATSGAGAPFYISAGTTSSGAGGDLRLDAGNGTTRDGDIFIGDGSTSRDVKITMGAMRSFQVVNGVGGSVPIITADQGGTTLYANSGAQVAASFNSAGINLITGRFNLGGTASTDPAIRRHASNSNHIQVTGADGTDQQTSFEFAGGGIIRASGGTLLLVGEYPSGSPMRLMSNDNFNCIAQVASDGMGLLVGDFDGDGGTLISETNRTTDPTHVDGYSQSYTKNDGGNQSKRFQLDGGIIALYVGSGDPDGAVTAPVGSIYIRTSGGSGTTLYVKESGTGSSGWVGK